MSRPHVPKFGEWADGENSYPYTVCFEKARKERAGDKSETLQPQVTPNMPPYGESRFQPPQPRARHHKTRPDNNNGDHKHSGSNSNHSSKSGSSKQSRRTRPQSSEEGDAFISSTHEPAAPQYVRVKKSSNDTASHDKGHKRDAKANRVRHNSIGDEHERVGVALPKFGQWDVNPASSEGGYTQVFNLKREGKKNIAKSPLLIPVPVDQQPINSRQRKSTGSDFQTSSNVHTASCCFPWSKR